MNDEGLGKSGQGEQGDDVGGERHHEDGVVDPEERVSAPDENEDEHGKRERAGAEKTCSDRGENRTEDGAGHARESAGYGLAHVRAENDGGRHGYPVAVGDLQSAIEAG